jgi:hypothetical protein
MSADFLDHLTALQVPIFVASPGRNGSEFDRPGGWQKLSADSNEARLAARRPGDALQGVMGGNVAVVDVDPQNRGNVEGVRALLDALGVRIFAEVETPGGGRHFYVAGHPDVPTCHSLTGFPGVDVISFRANVFLPGTTRAKYAGRGYTIVMDDLVALADGGDPVGAEIFAGWVADYMRSEPRKAAGPDLPHAAWDALGEPQRGRVERYLRAVVRGEAGNLAEAAGWLEGHRDERDRGWQKMLADVCYRFGGLARADWTPWDLADARKALGEIVPAEMAKAVGLDLTWRQQLERSDPARWPEELDKPEPEQFADIVAAGYGRDWPEPYDPGPEDNPAESSTDRARRLFPRLIWHDLWADEDEDEWLHVPLLPARRSIVIYSPPKIGKSLIVLEFAVALSRAETFLGHQIGRRIRVLYVDFENDPRGDIRTRLQAMGYGPDDLDHLDYLSFPTMAGLDTERGSLELLEAVKAYGSEVVILDTVSRAVDGEENSNDTWLGLYRHTGLKLKQGGVALVRLDHTGKDEMKGTRGGSAKSGDVDAIWRLTRITDERFRLECTDSRMPVETKSLQLTRHRLPRLHHTVVGFLGVTDHEAKVTHLVALCDSNGLPADANRDTVRALAKARGMGAGTDIIREVIKRRKADLEAQVSTHDTTATLADLEAQVSQPWESHSEHESADLEVSGQLRSGPDGSADLASSSLWEDASGQPRAEDLSADTCAGCGEPLSWQRAAYGKTTCVDCEREAS